MLKKIFLKNLKNKKGSERAMKIKIPGAQNSTIIALYIFIFLSIFLYSGKPSIHDLIRFAILDNFISADHPLVNKPEKIEDKNK